MIIFLIGGFANVRYKILRHLQLCAIWNSFLWVLLFPALGSGLSKIDEDAMEIINESFDGSQDVFREFIYLLTREIH